MACTYPVHLRASLSCQLRLLVRNRYFFYFQQRKRSRGKEAVKAEEKSAPMASIQCIIIAEICKLWAYKNLFACTCAKQRWEFTFQKWELSLQGCDYAKPCFNHWIFFKQNVVVQYWFLVLDSSLLPRAALKNNCLINWVYPVHRASCMCLRWRARLKPLGSRGSFHWLSDIAMRRRDRCWEWGLLRVTQNQAELGQKIWSRSAQRLRKRLWQLWLLVSSQWLLQRFCLVHKWKWDFFLLVAPSSIGWTFRSHVLT